MNQDNNQWPTHFVERIQGQFPDEWELFIQSLNNKTKNSIRINDKKFKFAEHLAKIPWSDFGFFLNKRPSYVFDPLWHAGAYYVQEASSMFLEQAFKQIEIDHPKLVLDLCAAPGGKSTHINSLIHENDLLIANEVIRSRVPVLVENLTKWGHSNFIVSNSDASTFGELSGLFDVIVVDAPCSGEGLFRREPEAANEWSVDNTQLCATRQRRIIAECWPALKTGGYLIYSTCTFNPDENEENLKWLKSQGNYESIPIPINDEWNIDEIEIDGIRGYRFLPHKVKGEGFFISLIRKTEEQSQIRLPRNFRQKLNRPSISVPNWIQNSIQLSYFQHQDQLKFIPKYWEKTTLLLLEKIRLAKVGTTIGQIKNKEIIPTQELAFNVDFENTQFPKVELSLEQAISFLRKENIILNSNKKGWNLVSFQNISLGFVKNLGTRTNNYYPKEWRIRMQGNEIPNPWHLT
ncbi:methyltransferase RsmF C-terminal domain-like protein [Sunxiuqinia sp. A32]|uniref:methyltransferase RsmF C-terminal domain-like protein n=1 Tax=Sunxiuqinia sp. A32 TaxID=3461496 RepID=UPI004046209B